MATTMLPTAEQRQILEREEAPVFLVNPDGSTTHVVVPVAEARRWFDDYVRRELQVAFDQAARGEIAPWDIETTLAEAHRRYSTRRGV